MRLDLFFQPFVVAFILSAGISFIFVLTPLLRNRKGRKEGRHGGKTHVSRFGGVAMIIAFFITVLWDRNLVISEQIFGLLIGMGLVFLFGIWDDIAELGWKIQIFFQTALTFIIFIFGMRIFSVTNPLGGAWVLPQDNQIIAFFALFVWLLLVMNAVNWLDGLDGLSGSVSLITFVTIFFLSLKPEVNQPALAILSVIGIAVVAGFLIFNIHPARIMAGTVGSMFLGFFITVLAVIAGTKIATALLVLSLPIADALWVIFERLRAKKSIFQADERHLHFKLRALGWSEGKIAWFFSSVTAIIAVIALYTETLGKFIAILLVLAIIFSLLIFVNQKTKSFYKS